MKASFIIFYVQVSHIRLAFQVRDPTLGNVTVDLFLSWNSENPSSVEQNLNVFWHHCRIKMISKCYNPL